VCAEFNCFINCILIAYLIAFKARPYSDFTVLIELEKLHGVEFLQSCAYDNDMA
jgi:hypothetical protein